MTYTASQERAPTRGTRAAMEAEVADLRAYCAILKGALVAADIAVPEHRPGWAADLSEQEAALMGVLMRTYPRFVDSSVLDDLLPHRDHAADRCPRLVSNVVAHIRKKLGPEAIETARGRGYRAGLAALATASSEPAPAPGAAPERRVAERVERAPRHDLRPAARAPAQRLPHRPANRSTGSR